ncbi:MAG: ribonuclease R [Blastocatellales bacterium]|nr:ribonuclease R [Blastocatellales bacterium]
MGLDIDAVLAALREFPDGVTVRELAEALDINRSQEKSLTTLLNRLLSTGLLRRRGAAYQWAQTGRVFTGRLRQRRRKTIHIIPDEASERARGALRVAPEDANGAFDGDRVVASLHRGSRGNVREALVLMVLARGQLRIVGRLHHGFRQQWVESLDEKFPYDINLKGSDGKQYEDGSIVIVEVTGYPSGDSEPEGRVIDLLGESSNEPGMDIQIVIHKHDLPHVFPPEVVAEAESVSPEVTEDQRAGRLDLREVPTVTIDGETARDFDDAISLRRSDAGRYELGVHIADVSYYVGAGTPLDAEARLRGTSVYFPERAIPMLPEHLSNGICSLNPKVDRLAMSALMEIDGEGRVAGYRLCETVIRSNERMTYTAVNQLLSHADPQLAMRYAELLPLFRTMEELARILIRMRQQRGAIDFNLPESVFEFDDEGRIAGVLKADRNIAHRIIEEFMLLANETVAGHFTRLGVPALYRIHEDPDPQRVIEFAELAAAYGYKFPASGVSSKDYQRLSKQLEGKPEERVMSYAMLRSLQRARYSAGNVGHFGLAAPLYTHFTSPIRRYPDLIVHRILRGLLKKDPAWGASETGVRRPGAPITFEELERIAEESSERERAADAAEREVDEWRKAAFMAERVGEQFEGMITNVREFGFFVELDEFFIEGLVSVSSLEDDYYLFDERKHQLRASSGWRSFRLGDRVKVRVDRVNVDRHLVDFSVAAGAEKKNRGTRGKKTRKARNEE